MSSVHKLEANTLRMQQFQVKQKKTNLQPVDNDFPAQ